VDRWQVQVISQGGDGRTLLEVKLRGTREGLACCVALLYPFGFDAFPTWLQSVMSTAPSFTIVVFKACHGDDRRCDVSTNRDSLTRKGAPLKLIRFKSTN